MRLKHQIYISILLSLLLFVVVCIRTIRPLKEGNLFKKIEKTGKKIDKSAKSDIKSVTNSVETDVTQEESVIRTIAASVTSGVTPLGSSSQPPSPPPPTKFQKFSCKDYSALENGFICDNVEMTNDDGNGTVYYQDFSCNDYSVSGSGFSCAKPYMTDVLYGTGLSSSFKNFSCDTYTITNTGFNCENVVMNPES